MQADLVLIDMKGDGAVLTVNGKLLAFDEAKQPFSELETLAQFSQRLAADLDTTLHTCTTSVDAVCHGRLHPWDWNEVIEFVFADRPSQAHITITG